MKIECKAKIEKWIAESEEIFGKGTAYVVIKAVVWENEIDCYFELFEEYLAIGHVFAVCTHGTNVPDLVVAFTERGWTNDEVLECQYGTKAVTFKK